MIVEGEHTFAARREAVWGVLLDPQVIAKTMPGTQTMVRTAPDRYEGKLRVGVGAITAAEFDLTVTLTDVVEPERYTLQIDGRGRFGFARGSAWVRLDESSASTVMRYRGDLQVGGKIAGVGQRLLDSIGKLMTRQGLEAVAREVDRRLGTGAGDEGGPGTPPSGGGTAP